MKSLFEDPENTPFKHGYPCGTHFECPSLFLNQPIKVYLAKRDHAQFAVDVAEMIVDHIIYIHPELPHFPGYGNLKFQIESFQEQLMRKSELKSYKDEECTGPRVKLTLTPMSNINHHERSVIDSDKVFIFTYKRGAPLNVEKNGVTYMYAAEDVDLNEHILIFNNEPHKIIHRLTIG